MKKVAIITGSSGGIGAALVKTFLNDDFHVLGIDKNQSDYLGGKYTEIEVDLKYMDNAEYRASSLKKIKDCIPIDTTKLVIINNAAIQITEEFIDIKYENLIDTFKINTFAPIILTQSFLKELKKYNGHVINISSIHSKLTKSEFTSYAASKSALDSVTKSMSIELSPEGILVNGISPAAIHTKMLESGFKNNHEKIKELELLHPSRSIGSPQELSNFIKSIVDLNSKFLSGSVINFNGGISNRLLDPESN